MASIAIIDYGMGNLHSIAKATEHVAGKLRVRADAFGYLHAQSNPAKEDKYSAGWRRRWGWA